MATKQQKIDFISKCIVFKMTDGSSKKLTKKELNAGVVSDVFINRIIEDNKTAFEEYLNQPKLISYYAECEDKSGNLGIYEVQAENEDRCRESLMQESEIKAVNKIAPKRGNHLCKYCGCIAVGSNKDLLCEDCHFLFGHSYYSEL